MISFYLYHAVALTDINLDRPIRDYAGWGIIGVVATSVVVNFIYSLAEGTFYIRDWWARRTQKNEKLKILYFAQTSDK